MRNKLLHNNATTWAIVPIKDFTRAKSRLRPLLTAEQCAELATCMAADVLRALRGCAGIGHVTCLGDEPQIRAFAAKQGCEFIAERADTGLPANLDLAARQLQESGAQTLLIVPVDLPTIETADIDECLKKHRGGLTICPAERDGGTNALIISPPTGIGFQFGEQSCAKHIHAAEAAGLEHRREDTPAFRYDIDTPADLAWLCNSSPQGRTGEYLKRSGLLEKIRGTSGQPPSAAIA
jgi:2-phospho-L-lactate guanylyltransferase